MTSRTPPADLPDVAFAVASAVERIDGGGWRGSIPTVWRQGRGAFGGLLLAMAHRAIVGELGAEAPPARSLTCHFTGPVSDGAVSIAVETLQSGRSVSHVTARLTQRTGSSATGSTRATIALVSAALAAPRSLVADLQTVSPPAGPAPETLRPVNFGAFGPRFVSHFDVRFTSGAPLFSRSPAPRFGAWVRLHDAPPADMALRLALLDVLPPAIFAALPAPRPVATVTLTAHLLNTTTVPGRDAWWHVDSEVIQQVDGYSTQENRLYDAQGTLLGRGLQVVAVVK